MQLEIKMYKRVENASAFNKATNGMSACMYMFQAVMSEICIPIGKFRLDHVLNIIKK